MPRLLLSLLLLIPALALAPWSGPASSATALGVPGTIAVSAVDLKFEPSDITARPGDTIVLTNDGALPHNLAIPELELTTETVNGGEVTEVTLPADLEPGTYAIECSVPGHAQAGMVGTLTVVAAGGDDEVAGDEPAADPPDVDIDLGDGWDVSDRSVIDLAGPGAGSIPATVPSFSGPESSLARVIVANVDVANGRPTYDAWETFITTIGAGLVPNDDTSAAPDAEGCLLQASVQGDEALTGARIGSTVCLTDDDRFVWASVSGEWTADDDALSYAEAAVRLVETVLDAGGD